MSVVTRLGRIVSGLLGVAILVLIAPHRNPWQMAWLPVDPDGISTERFGFDFHLPLWLPALVTAIVVIAFVRLAGRRRTVAPQTRLTSRDRLVLVLSTAVLVASLVPPAPRGRGVVVNLLLGTLGVSLLAAGLATPRLLASAARAGARSGEWLLASPPRRFALAIGGLVFVMANLGALLLLGHIPHVVDSAGQLFHAKILLTGQLTAPLPVPAESFAFDLLIAGQRWYSQYPPGHTLMLALGSLLRAPWIVNPLLGALSVPIFYLVGRECFDEKTARIAGLLGALSPFVWIMSSSFMNHATQLFCVSLFTLGYVRMVRHGQRAAAVVAGFAAGVALATRPLSAVAFVAPFAIHAAVTVLRGLFERDRSREARRLAGNALISVAALAVPAVGLLAFNAMTNGDPLVFGYEALNGRDALPGFGRGAFFWGEAHTPWRGLVATLNNLNALNQYLFALPLPALALVVCGLAGVRRTVWDGLLAASAATLAAAYFVYWYQDLAYGPRFLYSAVLPLILLAARSLTGLSALLRLPAATGLTTLLLGLVFVYGGLVQLPVLASYYARDFYGANAKLVRQIDGLRQPHSVVLVPQLYWSSLFPLNDPTLDGEVVYARDLGTERNRELASIYPDRSFYRIESLENYRLTAWRPDSTTASPSYTVPLDRSLQVELVGAQLSHLKGGRARDHATGDLGFGFRNNDALWISSRNPGIEAGVSFDSETTQTRDLIVRWTRSPDSGVVEIRLNGELVLDAIDLYSNRVGVAEIRVQALTLEPGPNRLLFRVIGKNERARGFGLGLDDLKLDLP